MIRILDMHGRPTATGVRFTAIAAQAAPTGGPVGYCWPGHAEIEREWKADRNLDFIDLVFNDSELILSTLENSNTWQRHGDGKAHTWHAATASNQLGTNAAAAYGAIASCLGTTRWWISYRTSGNWRYVLNGWECPPGGVGVWRAPAVVRRRRVGIIPVGWRYDRFDIRFRAESEPGAFHRFFVGFWNAPNS
jgi:hypothetical protein